MLFFFVMPQVLAITSKVICLVCLHFVVWNQTPHLQQWQLRLQSDQAVRVSWLLALAMQVVLFLSEKTMVLATLCIQVCIDKFLATVLWYKHLSFRQCHTSPQPLNDELNPSLKSNEMDKFRAKFGPWLWTHRLKLIIAAGLKRSRLWKMIRLVGWVWTIA